MHKVFIDGKEGTTGLRIYERLSKREDIELITLSEEVRKDIAARQEALNSCDIAFLCLPDLAAKEAVSLIENDKVVVIDTSTAHRTDPEWAYGFPELSVKQANKIKESKRISVPGCHASGFIALMYPLIHSGQLTTDVKISCTSITGYSGGGKNMIQEYTNSDRNKLLEYPRQYGLTQHHKHLNEMVNISGLKKTPAFSPIVADFYSGMMVSIPVFQEDLVEGCNLNTINKLYKEYYKGPVVKYIDKVDEKGFLSAGAISGKDNMEILVEGNEERIVLVARYDNLGKGASGAAIQCMNIKLGISETFGLEL